MDEVSYSNQSPWPTGSSASGAPIQRVSASGYGDDPANWQTASPSPGQYAPTGPIDTDQDGLPDDWETAAGLDLTQQRRRKWSGRRSGQGRAHQSPGVLLAGTNPKDPASALAFTAADVSPSEITLGFNAVPGRTYTVLYRESPQAGQWLKLADVQASAVGGFTTVADTTIAAAPARFYRLATPAVP